MQTNSSININLIFPTRIIQAVTLVLLLLASAFTASAQNHKTITVKSGDGIYSILRENGIPASYIDEFLSLNKSILKGSEELKIGQTYKLPNINTTTSSTTKNSVSKGKSEPIKTMRFSIFGQNHQDIEITSSKLNGAVYYLVSGHGGPDPGAVGNYNGNTLCEDEYAYDITLRLARYLLSNGATVYMITRDNNDGIRDGKYLKPDKDEKCYPNQTIPINHNARLRQRKNAVNQLYKKHKGKYQRLIVLHVDSRSTREKIDVFFYHDKRSSGGKELANNLRNTLDNKYNEHQPGRGYKGTISTRNLYMLKYTLPVATFIELGNINHQRDVKRFIIEDNREALGKWLGEGLMLDYKKNK